MEDRLNLLNRKCKQFENPFRIEHSTFYAQEPKNLGVEVVYLSSGRASSKPLISVCIPHKVGSHAWGQFSSLNNVKIDPTQQDLTWKVKAELSTRAIVVRHPLERLLSVYRMIFEDWCDQKRFLAQQWNNVCVTDLKNDQSKGFIEETVNATKFSAINFLYSMADEQRHGNDRYIQDIWHKFNPGVKLVDPKSQLKFSFRQFVRFITNSSLEFPESIVKHKGLSYHWAPYWKECSLCSSQTKPDIVIHMETFVQDLQILFSKAGYGSQEISKLIEKFPHTHSQTGGHSHDLIVKYYSQLTKGQVSDLYEMYKLDHELFGYDPSFYLACAS